MINDITIITPPDFLHNDALNLLVVCPSDMIKTQLNDLLKQSSASLNLLVYESVSNDIAWLLTAVNVADCIIFDIDNSDWLVQHFASLIVAKPYTFYLTNKDAVPYNLISKNRVYDLAWLNLIINRGKNEET